MKYKTIKQYKENIYCRCGLDMTTLCNSCSDYKQGIEALESTIEMIENEELDKSKLIKAIRGEE